MKQMAEIDLRDFPFMPLHVGRLQKSKAWLQCKRSPELAFYLMNLWMRAWHEVPAGSLDDDDDVLADAAMCAPTQWQKIKQKVLRNWEKGDDGRLYHPVVTELAAEAWARKQGYRDRAARARQVKQQKRDSADHSSVTESVTDAVSTSVTEPVTESVIESVTDSFTDTSQACKLSVSSLKGQGQGQGELREEKKDKAADAASVATKKYAFEGDVIRLTEKHFLDWTTAFPNLDLRGELIARDAWLASPRATDDDRKNWFISTSKYLANKNSESKAKAQAAAPKQALGGWV